MDVKAVSGENERRALYEQLLKCVDREESLVGHRQTWGLTINAALAAAIWTGIKLTGHQLTVDTPWLAVIASIGTLASSAAYIGVGAAHKQVRYLIDHAEKKLGVVNRRWEETEFLRPYGEPNGTHRYARIVARSIPLLACIGWIMCLLWITSPMWWQYAIWLTGHLGIKVGQVHG